MTYAAKTVYYFGIYLILVGIVFTFFPNQVLPLFGFDVTTEVWVHVIGVIAALLGYYYMYAAKAELTPFFRSTTHTRPVVLISFTLFVLLNMAPPALILFGVIDFVGAIWTWSALRKETA